MLKGNEALVYGRSLISIMDGSVSGVNIRYEGSWRQDDLFVRFRRSMASFLGGALRFGPVPRRTR